MLARAGAQERKAAPRGYQRETIYLSGGCINEVLNIILKFFGATPRKKLSGARGYGAAQALAEKLKMPA